MSGWLTTDVVYRTGKEEMESRVVTSRSLGGVRTGAFGCPAMSGIGIVAMCVLSLTGCSTQQDAKSNVAVEAESVASAPKPVAVVDESEADLGILDPTEKIEKVFLIRNEGVAPLTLHRGGTSCKCTMSTLPEDPIQPGQAAVVRVSTKSEVTEGRFDHSATILTNDPENGRITLRIYGKFLKVVAFDPPRLVLSSLSREKSTEVSAVVYSQYFRDFELPSIESSMEGLKWELEPAEPRMLERLEARCGYQLRLTFPPAEKAGEFWDTLRVTARSDDDPPEVREVTWQIAGSPRPRAQMSGEKFAADKVLRIGTVGRWQGMQERLTLTVHDDHPNLKIEAIEKDPDFLEVEVVPMNPEKPDSGLYWVNVAIPKGAPACIHTGERQGEIRIISDHPALPVMSFSVQFAITSS